VRDESRTRFRESIDNDFSSEGGVRR
jgi:hypothetical protein